MIALEAAGGIHISVELGQFDNVRNAALPCRVDERDLLRFCALRRTG
jgi:hypothetical protein